MRPKTDAAEYTSTLLRLPPALLEGMRQLAHADRRSLNSELLCAVEAYLAREGWRLLPPGPGEHAARREDPHDTPARDTGIRAEVILGA